MSSSIFGTKSYDSRLQGATIIHKILETNSSFGVKQRTMGTVQVLFLRRFLLALTKFSSVRI